MEVKISDGIKRNRADSTIWMHYKDAEKAYWEIGWREEHNNAMSHTKQILEVASHNEAAIWLPTSHL